MKPAQVLKESAEGALALLKLTCAAADVFPPLKGAAGGALHIAEMVKKFKSNEEDWNRFGDYVAKATACVIEPLANVRAPRGDLKVSLEKLCDTLVDTQRKIQDLQGESGLKRAWSFIKDPEKIAEMKADIDNALNLFNLSFTINTGLNVASMYTMASNHTLNSLPLAEGASWDPDRTCLPGTRVALLDDIWSWILSDENASRVFWLTGVAGSGKSAIAHTVAQRCHDHHLLASSFFFDRNIAGRNEPSKLFSTIARGLAHFDERVAHHIGLAIELEQTLATGPISRQFEELIYRPSTRYAGDKSIVIVIDALDEGGYDISLLKIFRDNFPKLHDKFRIFVTSRPGKEIDAFLSQKPHIRAVTIDIGGNSNLEDIQVYSRDRLQEVASRNGLPSDWPGHELSTDFTRKAEGLFMWVSTVTRYLSTTTHPHMKLAALLSGRCKSSIPTEKMDELYSDILGACDWRDEDFVAGYHIFVGAIMAVKTPLSLSALQILHRSTTVLQANEVLQTLRSLFTGLSDQSQPIRTLHVSLREFLTCRAQHLSRHERFYVNEKEHSERLALLCLLVLSEGLGRGIAGMGYLSAPALDKRGIPKMAEGVVTEELWYACRFWMDHVVEIEDPKPALINALCTFLSARFSAWMEVVTSKGRFHSLRQLREWLQKTVQRQTELADSARNFEVAVRSLKGLSERLSYMDRREEALEAIQAAVDFYELQRLGEVGVSSSQTAGLFNDLSLRLSDLGRREEALEIIQQAVRIYYQLEGDLLVYPMPELPLACRNLSICLSAVGRGEDALEVAQEAVNLFRQTSAVAFNAGLARSLSTLSTAFQNQDRPGEALAAIQQSVELFQPLAVENPTEFSSDLAKSLSNLSSCLWKLNRWMDAIGPIIQAVEICRQLAAERPAAFLSQLANTLINFSVCQCLDRGAALHASQEAIELYRQLASDRPAAFTADLANSLVNHSTCLSSMGLDEGALKAIQEAVQLYRSLSADQPIIFTQDLTSSLDRLSHCLSSLGHNEKAQDIDQERYGLLCSLVLSRVIRQHAREMEGGE